MIRARRERSSAARTSREVGDAVLAPVNRRTGQGDTRRHCWTAPDGASPDDPGAIAFPTGEPFDEEERDVGLVGTVRIR